MDRSWRWALFACIMIAFGVLYWFQHPGGASALRFTRVAEGNISQAVHFIWTEGFTGYGILLREDARHWGRVRPVHMLYYNLPFVLSLARSGELFRSEAQVSLPDRLNGDLQTHVWFLVTTLAIAAGAASWVMWRVSGFWWTALIFPVCLAASTILSENLLVNYCDSGEIAQLLFIGLYLAGIGPAFAGNQPGTRRELLATICLVLAYGMKETTVVLLPLFVAIPMLRWLPLFRGGRALITGFWLRQGAFHLLLAIILIVAVRLNKSGAYAAMYEVVGAKLIANLRTSFRSLSVGVPVVPLLFGGGLFALGSAWMEASVARLVDHRTRDSIFLAMASGALFVGFLMINLPWSPLLPKYLLPAHFFASMAATLLVAAGIRSLWGIGRRRLAMICLLGFCVLLSVKAGHGRRAVAEYFGVEYGYRRSVPTIARNIASSGFAKSSMPRILIVGGRLFQEGALPFQRHVNLIHGINIAEGGRVVQRVHSAERNYFRRYPRPEAVEINYSEKLPDRELGFDMVYVFGDLPRHFESQQQRMGALNYRPAEILRLKGSRMRIARYLRGASPEENRQPAPAARDVKS